MQSFKQIHAKFQQRRQFGKEVRSLFRLQKLYDNASVKTMNAKHLDLENAIETFSAKHHVREKTIEYVLSPPSRPGALGFISGFFKFIYDFTRPFAIIIGAAGAVGAAYYLQSQTAAQITHDVASFIKGMQNIFSGLDGIDLDAAERGAALYISLTAAVGTITGEITRIAGRIGAINRLKQASKEALNRQ